MPGKPAVIIPVQGRITSGWGDPRPYGQHEGLDIAAPSGTPVRAAGYGIVKKIGYDPKGYGHYVVIQHPGGYQTLYGHMSKLFVGPGQRVSPEVAIGAVGSTGYSTGPHLHFSILNATGRYLNPSVFPFLNKVPERLSIPPTRIQPVSVRTPTARVNRVVYTGPTRPRPRQGGDDTPPGIIVNPLRDTINFLYGAGLSLGTRAAVKGATELQSRGLTPQTIAYTVRTSIRDAAKDVGNELKDALAPLVIPTTGVIVGVIFLTAGALGVMSAVRSAASPL